MPNHNLNRVMRYRNLFVDGYGRTVLQLFRCQSETLPVTLGRDFSGTIVDKGHGIDRKYKCGDKVYGVIPFHKDGAHAEYAIVDESHVRIASTNLEMTNGFF